MAVRMIRLLVVDWSKKDVEKGISFEIEQALETKGIFSCTTVVSDAFIGLEMLSATTFDVLFAVNNLEDCQADDMLQILKYCASKVTLICLEKPRDDRELIDEIGSALLKRGEKIANNHITSKTTTLAALPPWLLNDKKSANKKRKKSENSKGPIISYMTQEQARPPQLADAVCSFSESSHSMEDNPPNVLCFFSDPKSLSSVDELTEEMCDDIHNGVASEECVSSTELGDLLNLDYMHDDSLFDLFPEFDDSDCKIDDNDFTFF